MTESIYSLLALAATASMALANGGGEDEKKGMFQGGTGVSFKPGSGISFDAGDEFRLNIKSTLQVRYTFESNDDPTVTDNNGFSIPLARIAFSGNAFGKGLRYRVELDAVNNENPIYSYSVLKEGWAEWDCLGSKENQISLRFGQSKPFFGLESTGNYQGLFFVDQSSASRTFANVRSRGAWLHGSHKDNTVRWSFGAQNGDVAEGATSLTDVGENTPNTGHMLTFVGGIQFDPWGDITGGKGSEAFMQGDIDRSPELRGTFGAGFQYGNEHISASGSPSDANDQATEFNLNAAIRSNGWGFQGEFFSRTDDPQTGAPQKTTNTGYYAQGTYTMAKSGDSNLQWGFGVRYDSIHLDTNSILNTLFTSPGAGNLGPAPGDCDEITLGIDAFYHGHSAKTSIDYTLQKVNPDTGTDFTNHIVQVSFQLVF